jgi:Spy/CpxP family protein refolding chaperone
VIGRALLRFTALAATAASLALATPATAQRAPGLPRGPGENRAAMQQLAVVVQRRLGLTNQQATRLRETTARFATERQQLMQREREMRRALRAATAAGDSAVDQRLVGRQLDSLVALQQRRVALLAEEQREMSTYLTPYQRAQFLAMQERAFRAAQQLRQRRAAQRGAKGDPLP